MHKKLDEFEKERIEEIGELEAQLKKISHETDPRKALKALGEKNWKLESYSIASVVGE